MTVLAPGGGAAAPPGPLAAVIGVTIAGIAAAAMLLPRLAKG